MTSAPTSGVHPEHAASPATAGTGSRPPGGAMAKDPICGMLVERASAIVLAVAILLLVGVSWWTAITVAVLLACPIAAVWTLVADRLSRREIQRGAR